MRRAAVLLVVALAAGVLGAPGPATACTLLFPGPPEEELLARADLVFEGVAVTSRDPSAGAPIISSGDPIFWTFAVDTQVKGTAGPLQEVATARFGGSCGFAFVAGVRYRVFATDQGGVLTTGLGTGTREAPFEQATTTTTAPPTTATTAPGTGPRATPTRGRGIALTG